LPEIGGESAAQDPPIEVRPEERAGFVERPNRGKGSHTFWVHSKHTGVSVTVAGRDGDDAKGYQEKQAREAIALAQSVI
jgi:hypothetical protein